MPTRTGARAGSCRPPAVRGASPAARPRRTHRRSPSAPDRARRSRRPAPGHYSYAPLEMGGLPPPQAPRGGKPPRSAIDDPFGLVDRRPPPHGARYASAGLASLAFVLTRHVPARFAPLVLASLDDGSGLAGGEHRRE